MTRIRLSATLATICFALAGSACERGPEWTGYVYPDRSNLMQSEFVGYFDTLESCRTTARVRLASLGATDKGDYECGYRCKPFDLGGLICERTER